MELDDYRADGGVVPEDAPVAFVELVKDALEHLHDLGYLERHRLGQILDPSMRPSPATLGQRLRMQLIEGIEVLDPGRGIAFRSPHSRQYHLLTLRYVDGRTVDQTAREMGISSRQALRGLRQGENGLAAVLWARCSAGQPSDTDAVDITSLQAEVARLECQLRPVDLRMLVQSAQEAVKPLAREKGVRVVNDPWPAGSVMVSADPSLAEQVLLSVLGRALVQVAPGGELRVSISRAEAGAVLHLKYERSDSSDTRPAIDQVVAVLAARAGWTIEERGTASPEHTITLQTTSGCATVLVIDDNQGLISLLQRFLGDQACQVYGATSGQEGLRLAQELAPDAILLDVMMPGMHGWDVLQRIRMHPDTAEIPVIVCSVVNNPELAVALGATVVLSKPVRELDVLAVLHQLGVVPRAAPLSLASA